MKRFLLIIMFGVLSFSSWAQCSMCRAVVENNSQNMAEGLNNGILYLMGFPYIILITLGVLLFRKRYRDTQLFQS